MNMYHTPQHVSNTIVRAHRLKAIDVDVAQHFRIEHNIVHTVHTFPLARQPVTHEHDVHCSLPPRRHTLTHHT